ncbi:MAG: hypothetical protein D4S01_11250, partial [Dehalococcoidia bacterium]
MLKLKGHKLNFNGSFLVFLLVSSFLVAILPVSQVSAADPTELTRKWTGYVAGGGESLLIYDAIPEIAGEEIFHAGGGPKPMEPGGSVTCLNGRNGNVIWKTGQGGVPAVNGIGDTCQIHMADMDNDGDMEIVVPLQSPSGLYILHAEDGSVMFSDTTLGGGRIDSSPVSGDVDGDGYPDLYVAIMAYLDSPETGHLIHFEYNGANIVERNRRVVWHPCAGGVSLADTDNDGTWELYMADRSQGGFVDGSWGRGLRSFWAENLTSRWDVYDNMMSSNIPMLADVNRDGILDVVATDLSRAALVLDSATGQAMVNDVGTELRGSINGRANHYQSSVYDIDMDGNLEIISGDGWEGGSDYVTVFDLWNWTLDASIDTTAVGDYTMHSWKGPTVGEVTGDGLMDIIVTCYDVDLGDRGMVQVYDHNFELVLYTANNFEHRAIDSVVQDVDRDDGGLNELLVLTQGGQIYCYDTDGLSEESQGRQRARSEVQFYGERRNGVSEYVSYEYDEEVLPDSRAGISFPSPNYWEKGVSTSLTELSFKLSHPLGEQMDYVVTCDPDIIPGSGIGTDVGDGVHTVSVSSLTSSTTYLWEIEVTDESGHVSRKEFGFVTENTAPEQDTPLMTGETTLDDLVCTPQSVSDDDGDEVTKIYNWIRDDDPIANLILPFDSMTDPGLEYSGFAYTRDYSGNGNDGNVFGASWTEDGVLGGAYSLDGSNDFIRIEEQGNSLGGNGNWEEISVEFWIKETEARARGTVVQKMGRPYSDEDIPNVAIYQYTGYRVDFGSSGDSNTITWRIYTENPEDEEDPFQYSLSADIGAREDWHHVVVTYTSELGMKIYSDGAEVGYLPGVSGDILETNRNSNTHNLGDYLGDWGYNFPGGYMPDDKGPLEISFGGMLDEL